LNPGVLVNTIRTIRGEDYALDYCRRHFMIQTARAEGYYIRIELLDVSPPVWRTMNVPSGIRLDEFSVLLMIAMGWEGSHLHQFRAGKQVIGHSDQSDHEAHLNEQELFIEDLFQEDISPIIFDYDFGDGWEHEITLLGELSAEDDLLVVIDGERACPPEDCGGPSGYDDLVQILANPNDPEYEEMLDWLGEDFDPEAFDIDLVNDLLAGLAEEDFTSFIKNNGEDEEEQDYQSDSDFF
jgi:hypothetical protein